MNRMIIAAVIIALGLVCAALIYAYSTPYQTCVRSYKGVENYKGVEYTKQQIRSICVEKTNMQ